MAASREQIAQLVADGKLEPAAELYQQLGDHAAACGLWEKLWHYQAASRAALAAGQPLRALQNLLRAGQPHVSQGLPEVSKHIGADELVQAAELCNAQGHFDIAGDLYQRAGQFDAAAENYQRDGSMFLAARALEQAGRYADAISCYQRDIDSKTADGPSRLHLGLLLARTGRFEKGLPMLQAEQRKGGEHAQLAADAVVFALSRGGWAEAARHAATLFATDSPRALERDPRFAPMGQQDHGSTLLGRYRLGDLLGSGGMGRVYKATDLLTEKTVAIKIFTGGGGNARAQRKQFFREANAVAHLDHPNIVRLLDVNDTLPCLVLEFMEGGTLDQRIHLKPGQTGKPMAPAKARQITLQLIAAVSAAHQRGVIHRDIKPSNIFFDQTGSVKLGDFGVAHLQSAERTQTGSFVGTVSFMAPEQVRGGKISAATDIHAIGATLFVMLTGRLPFEPPGVVRKLVEDAAPSPSEFVASLPPECDEVIARAMAKPPEDRFASLADLEEAVRAIPDTETAKPAAEASPSQDKNVVAGGQRYAFRGMLLESPRATVTVAFDRHLARTVQLVRTEGDTLIRKKLRHAAACGPALEPVLDGDQNAEAFVLSHWPELSSDRPAVSPWPTLLTLIDTLAPLHRVGLVHGAIAEALRWDQHGRPRLLWTPALVADSEGEEAAQSVTEELAGLLELFTDSASQFPLDRPEALREALVKQLETEERSAQQAQLAAGRRWLGADQ